MTNTTPNPFLLVKLTNGAIKILGLDDPCENEKNCITELSYTKTTTTVSAPLSVVLDWRSYLSNVARKWADGSVTAAKAGLRAIDKALDAAGVVQVY